MQQEKLERFMSIVYNYAVPPCVAATMPDFIDDIGRLDADIEKMFAFISTDWVKHGSHPLYKNCVIEDISVAEAIRDISNAHNKLLDLIADVVFGDKPSSENIDAALNRYKRLSGFENHVKELREYGGKKISEERLRKMRLAQITRLTQVWAYGKSERIGAVVSMLVKKIPFECGIETAKGEPKGIHNGAELIRSYKEVYFDGTYWRNIQGKHAEEIVGVASSWEIGAIFEIRRPRCV